MAASLWNYIWNGLEYVGIISKVKNIAVLGLDNSGKTTLLRLLQDPIPSSIKFMPGYTEMKFDDMTLRLHEFRPRVNGVKIQKHGFIESMDGIIFMIAVSDQSRFNESKQELMDINEINNKCHKVPILIFGNKIDRFTRQPQLTLNKFQLGSIFGVYSMQIIYDIIWGYIRINIETKYEELFIPSAIKELCCKYYIPCKQDDRLKQLKDIDDVPIEIFMCSLVHRCGFGEGIRWLVTFL